MSKTTLNTTQASLNQTALDWPQNMANIYEAVDRAIENNSDMLVLSELILTGYEVNDDFQRVDNDRIFDALSDVAEYAQAQDPNLIISIGHPWRLQLRNAFEKAAAHPDLIKNPLYDRLNLPFNVQTLLMDGKIISMTAKTNLFRDERGYENRYFNEWSFRDAEQLADLIGQESVNGTITIQLPDGADIPFGRPVIYVTDDKGHSYVHVQAICEEKWVATQYDGAPYNDERYDKYNVIPAMARYLGGTEGVLLEISNASPPTRLKQDKHMHLNQLASQYADVVIDTDGLGTSGATFAQFGHRLIAQNGKTISAGARMNFANVASTSASVEINNASPFLKNKAHVTLTRAFKNPDGAPDAVLAWDDERQNATWDTPENPDRWKEERIRNQALWMFDYMRKTGSKGIVEALSGGKDSAFNSAMVRVMVELAMHDLGVIGFCEAMPQLPYNDKILAAYKKDGHKAAVEVCMDNMLTCVYMGTNNSSQETYDAARTLVEGGSFENGQTYKGIGGKFLERNVQDVLDFYGYIFAVKDTTQVPKEQKLEIMEEISNYLNASPYDYTPEQMKAWGDELYAKYPQLENLVSAAIPEHAIGYENIQARGREVLIMLFANIENKMAVANPNLDEAYGAYATFGGDLHSGTVNWNAGLHKADQEALMEFLEDKGIPGVMDRVVSLALANKNKPTAELQPKKDGQVVQNDEDALQGTFPQKAILARLRHHSKVDTTQGARWMQAGELFDRARDDKAFKGLDDNNLFNAVTYFYARWEGPAQHKIHATPIAPTFGENVDKQTSLRTPNLSGGSKDEIVTLGIDLMYQWAQRDGLRWDIQQLQMLRKRAWQDKKFVDEFYGAIRNTKDNKDVMSYDLDAVYQQVKEKGFDGVFTPLAPNHPLNRTKVYRPKYAKASYA